FADHQGIQAREECTFKLSFSKRKKVHTVIQGLTFSGPIRWREQQDQIQLSELRTECLGKAGYGGAVHACFLEALRELVPQAAITPVLFLNPTSPDADLQRLSTIDL